MKKHHRHHSPHPGIAPPDLIQEDFEALKALVILRTNRFVEDLILMQSVEGHAHEGHGEFRGQRFVDVTVRDTVKALHRSPRAVAEERQRLIDDVVEWAKGCIGGKAKARLTNDEEEPFLGVGMFRQLVVNPPDVLRGFYLGGLRDDVDVRARVEQSSGLHIGGGRCYLVDVQVMREMGLNGEGLAHGEHENQIAEYKRKGMILDCAPTEGSPEALSERIRYMYIRQRMGGGTSDDAAIVAAGLLYNRDVAIGCFLADAVDTLEKYVPLDRYCDQDDNLAAFIGSNFSDLKVSDSDLDRLTALCAVPEEMQAQVPDSSLRHMLAVDRRVDQCALESHLLFVERKPYAPMSIAFERVANATFYSWIEGRVRNAKR
jgi:hypothetical protein